MDHFKAEERADLVDRIEELTRNIEEDTAERAKLKQELHILEYQDLHDRVSSRELPLTSLFRTSYGTGGYPDWVKCVVCQKGIHRFTGNSWTMSAGLRPSEIGGSMWFSPSVHVHECCVPAELKRKYR